MGDTKKKFIYGVEFILAAVLVYTNVFYFSGQSLEIYNQFFVALGVTGLYLINVFGFQKGIEFSWLDIPFATFILFLFGSFFYANDPSLIWVKGFSWLLLYLIFKWAENYNFQRHNLEKWKLFFLVIIILNILNTLFVLFEIVFSDGTFNFSTATIKELTQGLQIWVNTLSSYFLLTIPILFYYLKDNTFNKFLILGLIGIHFLLIIPLNSRGTTLAFLPFLFLFWFLYREKINLRILLLILALPLLFFGVISFAIADFHKFIDMYDITQSFNAIDNDDRLSLWKASIQLFIQNPMLGVGSGNWINEYSIYGTSESFNYLYGGTYYRQAHNFYFETVAENGFIGIIFIITVIFYPLIKIISLKNRISNFQKSCILIYFTNLFLIFFYGTLYPNSFNFFYPQLLFWIVSLAFIVKEIRIKRFEVKYLTILLSALCIIWTGYYLNNEKVMINLSKNKKLEAKEKIEIIKSVQNKTFFNYYKNENLDIKQAKFLKKRKHYNKSIEKYKQGMQHNRFRSDFWYELGTIYEEINKEGKAQNSYKKSLALNINNGAARLKRMKSLLQDNELEKFDDLFGIYYLEIEPKVIYIDSVGLDAIKDHKAKMNFKKCLDYEIQFLDLAEKRALKK